jgi:hypothetical protein
MTFADPNARALVLNNFPGGLVSFLSRAHAPKRGEPHASEFQYYDMFVPTVFGDCMG